MQEIGTTSGKERFDYGKTVAKRPMIFESSTLKVKIKKTIIHEKVDEKHLCVKTKNLNMGKSLQCRKLASKN